MANSIAFSIGSGSGGNIIKSIQRGESPIYTMTCGLHYDSVDNDQEVRLDQREIPISSVNPSKSIILVTSTFSGGNVDGELNTDVIVTDFTSSYIKCAIISKTWSSSATASSTGYLTPYKDSPDNNFRYASTHPLSFVAIDYWRENIYTGPDITDIPNVKIPTDQCMVSYQIIEFY